MTCTETNMNARLKDNSIMLNFLMQQARLVIDFDAHLEFDSAMPNFSQSTFLPEEIEVHRYAHEKMTRHMHMTKDSVFFESAIKRTLARSEKASILCRTKSDADVYAKMFEHHNPIVFSSDITQHKMDEAFKDINE